MIREVEQPLDLPPAFTMSPLLKLNSSARDGRLEAKKQYATQCGTVEGLFRGACQQSTMPLAAQSASNPAHLQLHIFRI